LVRIFWKHDLLIVASKSSDEAIDVMFVSPGDLFKSNFRQKCGFVVIL